MVQESEEEERELEFVFRAFDWARNWRTVGSVWKQLSDSFSALAIWAQNTWRAQAWDCIILRSKVLIWRENVKLRSRLFSASTMTFSRWASMPYGPRNPWNSSIKKRTSRSVIWKEESQQSWDAMNWKTISGVQQLTFVEIISKVHKPGFTDVLRSIMTRKTRELIHSRVNSRPLNSSRISSIVLEERIR